MDNSLETSSTSSSESEADIPIPRSRQQRPVHVIHGQVRQQDIVDHENHLPEQPFPQIHPCLYIRLPPLAIRDIGKESEDETAEIGVSESEGEGAGMGPKSDDKLVPTATVNGLEVQERGVEMLATLQSSENELQRDPP